MSQRLKAEELKIALLQQHRANTDARSLALFVLREIDGNTTKRAYTMRRLARRLLGRKLFI